jgi:hypothetical protein
VLNYIEENKSELFIELSEQEQEVVAGGYDVLLQKTDIATYGNNETTASDGARTFSSKSQTAYILSQITIGFNLAPFFQVDRNRGRRSSLSSLNFLYRLLRFLL